MAKKMKIPSIFKNKEVKPPWQWRSCKQQPKTHSFRADDPESSFMNSEEDPGGESMEMIIHGVQSERLIFKPGNTSSSILDEAKTRGILPFKDSVVLALESDDPYIDFKKSMKDMVETHGLKDWECLEELLGWFLKMNEKTNHRFIIGAFVDLLTGLASSSCSDLTKSCSSPPTSASSSFSSSPDHVAIYLRALI